jgi:hypothetical protein
MVNMSTLYLQCPVTGFKTSPRIFVSQIEKGGSLVEYGTASLIFLRNR